MVADPACPPPPAPDMAARIASQVGHVRQLVSKSGLPPDQWDDALLC